MSVIAVTGADGFVGRALCRTLAAKGETVRPVSRDAACADVYRSFGLDTPDPVVVGDIGADTDWGTALEGVDAVIHLAARVHVMTETEADPLAVFRAVNTEGTRRLAESAAAAVVRRVVLISTIKVNGESTTGRAPFREDDPPAPRDPYAVSKFEAERALFDVAAATSLEAVVVRPPLVYGPGAAGNLLRLMRLLERGRPLPLAGLHNRRSLIGVENLADLLATCAVHPAAAGRVLVAADDEVRSTTDLIEELAAGLGRPARLFRFPLGLIAAPLRAIGRGAVLDRLLGSLEVEAATTRRILDWRPPMSGGLREMARAYLSARSARP